MAALASRRAAAGAGQPAGMVLEQPQVDGSLDSFRA
jgi:hypothetical protein